MKKEQNKKVKIGLALSSGGARGGVHIGVIKVLREANIPIDCLSGSSGGAIVAACYACGTLNRLEKVLKDMKLEDIVNFLDPHLSKESLIKGEKVLKFLRWLTDDKDFKEAGVPIYIMASDLKTGREVVFTKGKIARALLASLCVPPLFKPVVRGKSLLVDGGLIHLLPVAILKKHGCDIVIASTLEQKVFLSLEGDSRLIRTYKAIKEIKVEIKNKLLKVKEKTLRPEILGKVNILKQILREIVLEEEGKPLKKAEKYSFFQAILDCFDRGVTSPRVEEKMADIVIKTDVNGIRTFDLHRAYECIKRGERETRKNLPKLKRLLRTTTGYPFNQEVHI